MPQARKVGVKFSAFGKTFHVECVFDPPLDAVPPHRWDIMTFETPVKVEAETVLFSPEGEPTEIPAS